jgi:hypothetical protein
MSERLQCISCSRQYDIMEVRYTCDCGGLLSVERTGFIDRDAFDDRRTSRSDVDRSGVWRFREGVLNLDRVPPIPKVGRGCIGAMDCCSSTRAKIRPARSRTAA